MHIYWQKPLLFTLVGAGGPPRSNAGGPPPGGPPRPTGPPLTRRGGRLTRGEWGWGALADTPELAMPLVYIEDRPPSGGHEPRQRKHLKPSGGIPREGGPPAKGGLPGAPLPKFPSLDSHASFSGQPVRTLSVAFKQKHPGTTWGAPKGQLVKHFDSFPTQGGSPSSSLHGSEASSKGGPPPQLTARGPLEKPKGPPPEPLRGLSGRLDLMEGMQGRPLRSTSSQEADKGGPQRRRTHPQPDDSPDVWGAPSEPDEADTAQKAGAPKPSRGPAASTSDGSQASVQQMPSGGDKGPPSSSRPPPKDPETPQEAPSAESRDTQGAPVKLAASSRERLLEDQSAEPQGPPSKLLGPPAPSSGPPAKPSGPPGKPLGSLVQPSEAASKPSGPPSKPSGPPVKSLGPPAEPSGPPAKPSGPPPEPGGPLGKSSEARSKPSGPPPKPLGPLAKPSGPAAKPPGPTGQALEHPAKPSGPPAKPLGLFTKLMKPASKPPELPAKPSGPPPKPSGLPAKPSTAQPSNPPSGAAGFPEEATGKLSSPSVKPSSGPPTASPSIKPLGPPAKPSALPPKPLRPPAKPLGPSTKPSAPQPEPSGSLPPKASLIQAKPSAPPAKPSTAWAVSAGSPTETPPVSPKPSGTPAEPSGLPSDTQPKPSELPLKPSGLPPKPTGQTATPAEQPVEPPRPPAKPPEPPAKPLGLPIKPSGTPGKPSGSPVKPSGPPAKPLGPPSEASKPPLKPSGPTTKESGPPTKSEPSKHLTKLSPPKGKPTEVPAKPSAPPPSITELGPPTVPAGPPAKHAGPPTGPLGPPSAPEKPPGKPLKQSDAQGVFLASSGVPSEPSLSPQVISLLSSKSAKTPSTARSSGLPLKASGGPLKSTGAPSEMRGRPVQPSKPPGGGDEAEAPSKASMRSTPPSYRASDSLGPPSKPSGAPTKSVKLPPPPSGAQVEMAGPAPEVLLGPHMQREERDRGPPTKQKGASPDQQTLQTDLPAGPTRGDRRDETHPLDKPQGAPLAKSLGGPSKTTPPSGASPKLTSRGPPVQSLPSGLFISKAGDPLLSKGAPGAPVSSSSSMSVSAPRGGKNPSAMFAPPVRRPPSPDGEPRVNQETSADPPLKKKPILGVCGVLQKSSDHSPPNHKDRDIPLKNDKWPPSSPPSAPSVISELPAFRSSGGPSTGGPPEETYAADRVLVPRPQGQGLSRPLRAPPTRFLVVEELSDTELRRRLWTAYQEALKKAREPQGRGNPLEGPWGEDHRGPPWILPEWGAPQGAFELLRETEGDRTLEGSSPSMMHAGAPEGEAPVGGPTILGLEEAAARGLPLEGPLELQNLRAAVVQQRRRVEFFLRGGGPSQRSMRLCEEALAEEATQGHGSLASREGRGPLPRVLEALDSLCSQMEQLHIINKSLLDCA
ncbi:hypothetical protein ACSSS7_006844 [Eimeria intestinalis]